MAVKLRLKRMGSKQRPFYRIETVGTYNPIANPAEISINKEAALKWLANGAQPTDTVKAIFKNEGILKAFNDAKKGK